MIEKIEGLTSVNGSIVEAPFTDKSWHMFDALVDDQFKLCRKTADDVIV